MILKFELLVFNSLINQFPAFIAEGANLGNLLQKSALLDIIFPDSGMSVFIMFFTSFTPPQTYFFPPRRHCCKPRQHTCPEARMKYQEQLLFDLAQPARCVKGCQKHRNTGVAPVEGLGCFQTQNSRFLWRDLGKL
jgi:hypothetical protein